MASLVEYYSRPVTIDATFSNDTPVGASPYFLRTLASPRNGPNSTERSESLCPRNKIKKKTKSPIPDALLLPNGHPDYLRLILTSKVYDVVEETPLTHAINLSNRLGCNVLLKREDLQPVFSFKLRGAYNRMAHLDAKERRQGVIACSAGNHGQGVAYAAQKLEIPATIVMPSGTPEIKHKNVSRLGASVILHGADFDAAKAEAARLERTLGLTNLPPFDDPYVIAGQGTIGVEILRQTNLQDIEAIFCCIGGGGLIAGIGVYVKRIAPHIKIVGVETYHANAMIQSLQSGERVVLSDVGLFADGKAVKTIGEENYRLCKEVIDEIVQVTTDETCAAIKDVFEDTRSILEPAGALALAGLKKYVGLHPSQKSTRGMVAIASGANMNFDRLRFVAERAALGENKEALLGVTIDEKPGAFAELVQDIYPHSVTEFSYRYRDGDDRKAHILLSVAMHTGTRNRDLQILTERLEVRGIRAKDLSGDELVKSHLRYMGGGRSRIRDEHLYSFEFPERPGALAKFLTTLQPGFNITLFHYRDYGSDVGKVLAGIQVPPGGEKGLEGFLKKMKYTFHEETNNATYKQFLLE